MPSLIDCPECRRKLQLPEELMGREVKCPTCGSQFIAAAPPISPPPSFSSNAPAAPDVRLQKFRADDDDDRPHDKRDPYADEDDDTYRRRRRRRRRRDLMPHRGGMILTLGIVGLTIGLVGMLFCPIVFNGVGVVLGLFAWIMGSRDLQAIRAGTMDPDGQTMTHGGWICGIIATIGNGLVFLACGLGMMFYLFLVVAAGAN